jgi:hypothetical protein
MKLIFNILLPLTLSSFVYNSVLAQSQELSREDIRALDKEYLKKLNLPIYDGEIKITNAKNIFSSSNDKYYISQIHRFLEMHEEQVKNGYVNEQQTRAQELIQFKNSSIYQFQKYQNDFSMKGTFLRKNSNELIMAYDFHGVPSTFIDENIGYAPYGAFKETKNGDEVNGWDGAIQFFTKKDIGTCEYKEHSIKISHGGVELIKELVSYEINHKPTIILVQGTNASGYLYQVSWYDDNFSRQLNCASSSFSQKTKEDVIELARNIENAQ